MHVDPAESPSATRSPLSLPASVESRHVHCPGWTAHTSRFRQCIARSRVRGQQCLLWSRLPFLRLTDRSSSGSAVSTRQSLPVISRQPLLTSSVACNYSQSLVQYPHTHTHFSSVARVTAGPPCSTSAQLELRGLRNARHSSPFPSCTSGARARCCSCECS